MKKIYIKPSVIVFATQMDSMLMAGSITTKDEHGSGLEGIIGGNPIDTGTDTPIDADSKSFIMWDE